MTLYLVTTASIADDDNGVAGDLAAETADGEGLSYNEALILANADPGHDEIRFAPGLAGATIAHGYVEPDYDTYFLTPVIRADVTIDGDVDGDGAGDITIDGGYVTKNLVVLSGADAVLRHMNLTGGYVDAYGGGYYDPRMPDYGGGFYVQEGAALTLIDTTVSGAGSFEEAGGVYGVGGWTNGELTLISSTLSGNWSECGFGAALGVGETGSALVINSLVARNQEQCGGTAIYARGDLTLISSSVINNTSGSSDYGVSGETVTILNSVIAGNGYYSRPVEATHLTAGGSFFDIPTVIHTDLGGNFNGDAPAHLNGDGTPKPISPLMDAGDLSWLPADTHDIDGDGDVAEPLPLDVLGGLRVSGDGLDIGAIEAQVPDLVIEGTDAADVLDGAPEAARIFAMDGADMVRAGGGDDLVFGGGGNDRVLGQSGDDAILAGRGSDFLHGQAGDDDIYGEKGFDRILGGTGDDRLTGGLGRDTFFLKDGWGVDAITDFELGHDRLKLFVAPEDVVVETLWYQTTIRISAEDAFVLQGVSATVDDLDLIFA